MEKFLTTVEAAKILGITRVWVWKLIKMRKLDAQRAGRIYLIKPSEVRRYLKEMNTSETR